MEDVWYRYSASCLANQSQMKRSRSVPGYYGLIYLIYGTPISISLTFSQHLGHKWM